MATRVVFTPYSAEFPASNFPELTLVNRRPVLAFDASTDETCYWTFIAPVGLTGAITVHAFCIMASATTGNVILQGALEAVTPADATDLDSTTSFATINSSSATAVEPTAGYLFEVSITMTNTDSIAAGDYVRLSINRDADAGGDTATGDLYLLAAEFRDAA